jgi:translation initiation factor IF-3
LIRGVWTVGLIDENGKSLGTYSFRDAMKAAEDRGLDLVEVNAYSNPVTCRLMNFGQYKYEEKKKQKKINTKNIEVLKEVGLTVTTSPHDLEIKSKAIQEWLSNNYKVLIKLKFKGREVTFANLGFEQLNYLTSMLQENTFVIDSKPSLNGKYLTMVLKANKNNNNSLQK